MTSPCELQRGWCPKFSPGLNSKIGIVQKVYVWSNCPFAKMILQWGIFLAKGQLDHSYTFFTMLNLIFSPWPGQILGITLYFVWTVLDQVFTPHATQFYQLDHSWTEHSSPVLSNIVKKLRTFPLTVVIRWLRTELNVLPTSIFS